MIMKECSRCWGYHTPDMGCRPPAKPPSADEWMAETGVTSQPCTILGDAPPREGRILNGAGEWCLDMIPQIRILLRSGEEKTIDETAVWRS